MIVNFISLGNELKPELKLLIFELVLHFISLGNELKPELSLKFVWNRMHFISLGNELKPEHQGEKGGAIDQFYIVRKRA